MAGRTTLVKAVLTSVVIYFITVLDVPMELLMKIDSLRRAFLWSACDKSVPSPGSRHPPPLDVWSPGSSPSPARRRVRPHPGARDLPVFGGLCVLLVRRFSTAQGPGLGRGPNWLVYKKLNHILFLGNIKDVSLVPNTSEFLTEPPCIHTARFHIPTSLTNKRTPVAAMAAFGSMLASAVIKVVVQELSSTIGSNIKMQKNFKKDLEEMRSTLESVEAVLKDAEKRSINDAAVRLWLERLKKAMYDISDMVIDFETNTEVPAGQKILVISYCLQFVPKIVMANKMRIMRGRLENITKQHQNFSFMPDGSSTVRQVSDIRETSSFMEETLIIGRSVDKQKMLAILSVRITEQITIVPIHGIGGIGKTTLAKLVFNDNQFKDYSRVWVYVSQKFDLNKIGNSIISQVSDEQSQLAERQMIHNRLGRILVAKDILIVLDDLWERDPSQLEDLKAMLTVRNAGKVVVVVTTRDQQIAMKLRTRDSYEIEPLTNEMCWAIIKQKSSFETRPDKELLEMIGRDIAKKCGGVALAAQSLGYMLQSMRSDEWASIRDSDVWNGSTPEDGSSSSHVLASLKLSYSSMHPYLKLCFAYCAIFPKGHNIVKNDLIYQWISLGFIDLNTVLSTRQLSENYINQLLWKSFLQRSQSPSIDGLHDKDVTLFTMHDLVHDLARSVMVNEILDASKQKNMEGGSCRYALLTDCSKSLKLTTISPKKIRTIRFLDCGKIELCGAAFLSAKYLCVLDLSECSIKKLPDSVEQLKQLRYLNAPRMQNGMFPKCITKLLKLNYLNLRGSSNISAIPESIGKMGNLMHLDLSYCSSIHGRLPSSFADLKELVNLNLSHCYQLDGILDVLCGLTKLQHLNLSRPRLSNSRVINPCLTKLPEVISNLKELRYLNMSGCSSSQSDSSGWHGLIKCICTMSSLEHLDLSCNELFAIPECIGSLTKLHTLNLSQNRHLIQLPESMVKLGNLKVLNVNGCFHLSMSAQLSARLPLYVVHANDCGSGSSLAELEHANPDGLRIRRLEELRTISEVKRIQLIEKQRMKELTLEWSGHPKRFMDDVYVLQELVPPTTLKHFMVRGYDSVSFPAWLMSSIRYHLPNLVSITMWNLPKCNNLPPLGQLPNLQTLVLIGMESLEEWNTTSSSGEDGANKLMFPNLQTLRISDCPKLKMRPHPPRVVSWLISNSDNVMSSWGEHLTHNGSSSSSSAVTYMQVQHCNVPLHQWRLLHHQPVLTGLTIANCSDLTSSPDIMQVFSSLESVTFGVNGQSELPEWLGELTSLRQLEITDPTLTELNANIGKLTQLQSLRLFSCSSMIWLPPWLGKLTHLKELEIWGCLRMISSLEEMEQLTSLEYLTIQRCPGLLHSLGLPWQLEEDEFIWSSSVGSLSETIRTLGSITMKSEADDLLFLLRRDYPRGT
ncbi:putative disease resistance protein RGA1 [Lolium rigidum]|uniref:putative disease resistance protein RGA1 n=1 Tax=Lolium rigidum TaxID=89674 RepID=UPI001F5DD7A2|nr:putative disease resistance protein RGA1 [Lolium rigidum]